MKPQPPAPAELPKGPRRGASVPASSEIHPATRAIATLMDDLVAVPGTRFHFGADAVAGLLPGLGDAATTAMSGVILADAVRLGVPLPILGRMVANCAIDAAIGQVPLVGDLGDFAFKSNRLNMRLLEQAVADPERTKRRSAAYLAAAVGLVLLALVVMVGGLLLTLWWLGHLLGVLG